MLEQSKVGIAADQHKDHVIGNGFRLTGIGRQLYR
jgi:hypothetical protein